MNKTLQWTIGIGVVLIVLAISFSLVAPLLFPNVLGEYGYVMMGGRFL